MGGSAEHREVRSARFATTVASGAIGGLGCSVLDGLLARRGDVAFDAGAQLHAAALDTIAGCVVGVLVAVAAAAVTRLAGRRAPAWVAVAPAAIPLIAAFLLLNHSLFDGAWVSAQWWAPVGRIVFLAGGSIGIVVGLMALLRLATLRGPIRLALAVACACAAVAATWICLNKFAAYPNLRWQLAVATLVAALGAMRFMLPSRGAGRPAMYGTIGLFVAATAVAVAQRHTASIHAIRTTILGVPFAVTSHVMRPIEGTFLRLFGSPSAILPPRDVAPLPLEGDVDQAAIEAYLDGRAPSRRQFSVVMIAIDALRADHMSCHGYARPTTPNLDAFARTASWFRRAVSPIPASSMGYSSTMTGLYGRVSPAYAAEFSTTFPVPEKFSLASQFRAASRRTYGLTAFYPSVAAQPNFRVMSEGFERWNEGPRPGELDAARITDQALGALKELGDAPSFAFFHYMDPHAPYVSHPAHDFGTKPVDAYDSEIAYADSQIGRVLDAIDASDLRDRTIVVVFADHGEGFGEHNNREHGASLHDHQVRVPLMIRVPGIEPRAIDAWVGLSDLHPTLLRLTGVADPHRRLGRDLTPLMCGVDSGWPGYAYSERAARADKEPRSWERAVWHGDLKLIWKPHHDTVAVYDIAQDPRETRNLYAPDDETHARLYAILRAHDARIDGYWSGDDAAPAPVASLVQRFGAAVDAVVGARDDAAAQAALFNLMPLLHAAGVEWRSGEKHRLGPEALERLRGFLAAGVPRWPDSPLRMMALKLLAFMDDRALDDVVSAGFLGTAARDAILDVGVALARHGRREVLPALVAGFETSTLDARVGYASGLALLGDGRGRDLLTAALDRTWSDLLAHAVRGLCALGDPTPLAMALTVERPAWRHASVEEALLDAARGVRTPTANAVLLQIAGSVDERLASAANAALLERFPPSDAARLQTVREAFAGAANAALYHNSSLALGFLRGLSPEDDGLIGYHWWTVMRHALAAGDADVAARALERLVASAPEVPGVDACAAAVRAALAAGFDPGAKARLAAERAGDLVIPRALRGHGFLGRVRLTNVGETYAAGGSRGDVPRLGWRVRAGEREVAIHERIRHYLPDAGLAAGASLEVDLMGRLPDRAGVFTIQLMLAPDDWGEQVPVGDPVTVTLPP